ncbi:MAG: MFS transporter [Xenococcaceae cyanobacterium]
MQLSKSEQQKRNSNSKLEPIDNNSAEHQRDRILIEPVEHSSKQGFMPVLSNRRFLTLWSGQVFSQLADKVYLVLMIALVDSLFKTAEQPISRWVSPIMIAFTIPAILFGSLAGVYVDRWSKKAVMVISNLLRGILVLTLPLLLWLSGDKSIMMGLPLGFGFMLAVTFLVSTLTQFFAPAEQAVIPIIVKREYLLAANSLYTTTMMGLLIVGFAVGEPLLYFADRLVEGIGIGGDIGKELVVGGSYAIAGLLLLALKTGENQIHRSDESPHPFQDIKDGLRYLGDNHRVRNALIQLVILFSVFAALAAIAVSLAEKIPGLDAPQFGVLLAAAGVGMALSATALGYLGQKLSHSKLSLIGSIGVTASLIGLSLSTQNLWLSLITIALLGAFAALIGVPMQTAIQSETPPDMRGKVFGLQNNAVNIALSLPLALAGEAEVRLGLQPVLWSLSALVIAGGLLNWYISRTNKINLSKVGK